MKSEGKMMMAKGRGMAKADMQEMFGKKKADKKKPAKKMAKGGSIDGCATKGKTHATMVKMAKGGKYC